MPIDQLLTLYNVHIVHCKNITKYLRVTTDVCVYVRLNAAAPVISVALKSEERTAVCAAECTCEGIPAMFLVAQGL